MTPKYSTIRSTSVCAFLRYNRISGGAGGFGCCDSRSMNFMGHSCKTHGYCAKSSFVGIEQTAVKIELIMKFL